jgi:AGZA family xanthine/uracil permease-like MFS transporter
LNALAKYFGFAERGTDFATESRAGLTTFMVMAYIIFVNPRILIGGITAAKLPVAPNDAIAYAAATALIAGIMTIAMGIIGRYPLALAAGLGINGIVAYTLIAGKGLTVAGAMGVIVLEGVVITILVVIGLREAIMNAVPLVMKRSIGVGIGLFILFIGFVNGGLIVTPAGGSPIVGLAFPTQTGQFVFLFGLLITFAMYVRKVRAALIISIFVTTIVALLTGVATVPAGGFTVTPSFSTLGNFDLGNAFSKLGWVSAVLMIFAIMLSDFFDTMGTVTGIAEEAGLTTPDGAVPGIGRVLFVDSLAAVAGGMAGISSNTTYIESAAGVAEGGRTGFTAIVTGLLFLLAVFLSPLAGIVPSQATAPALVLVGYLMFTLIKDINVSDVEDGLPALLAIILMPLTYDITVGIGAGFISWVLIKILVGKWNQIHWLMYGVTISFIVYFAKDWIQTFVK